MTISTTANHKKKVQGPFRDIDARRGCSGDVATGAPTPTELVLGGTASASENAGDSWLE